MNNKTEDILKRKINVKIGNTTYNLLTTESEKYIQSISKYINDKISHISEIYNKINPNSVSFFLILTLNITDELFKQRQKFIKTQKTLAESTSTENSQNKSQHIDNSETKLEIENLQDELSKKDKKIKALEEEISLLKSDIESLNAKNGVLNETIAKNNKTMSSLAKNINKSN